MTVSFEHTQPLNAETITEASFAKLTDIGLEVLASRDATVIERLTLPGYEDFLGDLAVRADGCMVGQESEALLREIQTNPVVSAIRAGYERLVGGECFRHSIVAETGFSPKQIRLPGHPTLRPHVDTNIKAQNRVTANLTLFTAEEGWNWGLSSQTTMHERDMSSLEPEITVPLKTGGLVLMGEKARFNNLQKNCTPVHEVISPEASWNSGLVQRIRMVSTKR